VGVFQNQWLSKLGRILSWRWFKTSRVSWIDLMSNKRRSIVIWSQILCHWHCSLCVVVPWVWLFIRVVNVSNIITVSHILLVQRLSHLWLRLLWWHDYSRNFVHHRIRSNLLLNHLFLFNLVLNEIHCLLDLLRLQIVSRWCYLLFLNWLLLLLDFIFNHFHCFFNFSRLIRVRRWSIEFRF
jgi:hypothetical protein